jgi:hypothetical protein
VMSWRTGSALSARRWLRRLLVGTSVSGPSLISWRRIRIRWPGCRTIWLMPKLVTPSARRSPKNRPPVSWSSALLLVPPSREDHRILVREPDPDQMLCRLRSVGGRNSLVACRFGSLGSRHMDVEASRCVRFDFLVSGHTPGDRVPPVDQDRLASDIELTAARTPRSSPRRPGRLGAQFAWVPGGWRYLTAITSAGRILGAEASSSSATWVRALGISPLMCAWRASSVSKVSKMP